MASPRVFVVVLRGRKASPGYVLGSMTMTMTMTTDD